MTADRGEMTAVAGPLSAVVSPLSAVAGPRPAVVGPRSAVVNAMPTVRQRIIDLIRARAMDAREISAAAGVGEKDVYAHMEHIARSVAGQGKTFRLNPAACLACGHVFRDRRRMTRPSRCPRCKEQRISLPTYSITG